MFKSWTLILRVPKQNFSSRLGKSLKVLQSPLVFLFRLHKKSVRRFTLLLLGYRKNAIVTTIIDNCYIIYIVNTVRKCGAANMQLQQKTKRVGYHFWKYSLLYIRISHFLRFFPHKYFIWHTYRFYSSLSLFLFYKGVKMYNSLPANIKQSDRLETFKHQLKEYIPSTIKYIMVAVVPNWFNTFNTSIVYIFISL